MISFEQLPSLQQDMAVSGVCEQSLCGYFKHQLKFHMVKMYSRCDEGNPQLPNPPHPTPPQQVLTMTTSSVSSNKGTLNTHLVTYSWLYPICIQV